MLFFLFFTSVSAAPPEGAPVRTCLSPYLFIFSSPHIEGNHEERWPG
ncbi:hypothetical protein ES332_D11G070800v1 [Gossypium tomentosum]|uniref:Uncharacterized protein n=1 Tax=Gossypium tomentosum TaxID=34277 RepID=A0A5D2IIV3_GOSTO|nr:hypothetical protein ES332_D11G070800v1 [Gossypium tomentosum]